MNACVHVYDVFYPNKNIGGNDNTGDEDVKGSKGKSKQKRRRLGYAIDLLTAACASFF